MPLYVVALWNEGGYYERPLSAHPWIRHNTRVVGKFLEHYYYYNLNSARLVGRKVFGWTKLGFAHEQLGEYPGKELDKVVEIDANQFIHAEDNAGRRYILAKPLAKGQDMMVKANTGLNENW